MYRPLHPLILLMAIAACRPTGSEADRAERMGSEAGVEFEAPRLIPAIRAQIREIEDPERASEGNLTAFKNGVGTLVSAMRADLNRVGVTDTVTFYALSDSVTRELDGGAGDVVARVERLIGIYEGRMRKAAN